MSRSLQIIDDLGGFDATNHREGLDFYNDPIETNEVSAITDRKALTAIEYRKFFFYLEGN